MLKFLKYEIRKRMVPLIIAFILLLITQIYFTAAVFLNSAFHSVTSMFLLIMVGSTGYIFLLLDGIISYANELKDKRGYMLFLTPNSTYKIIGGKVAYVTFTTVAATVTYMAIVYLDYILVASRYPQFNTVEFSLKSLFAGMGLNIEPSLLAVTLLISLMTGLLCSVILGYLCVTISTTILSNSKMSGFLSFVLFIFANIATNSVINKLSDLFFGTTASDFAGRYISSIIFMIAANIVVAVISFIGSGYLLDKKISL